ncbi:MAG: ATP-grasp domain-containing protein [Oscillatoria princeps RMCB-10]|nr:ATP-grasp domain-containing protein [Oscillatoria princeps RMCB-10]
MTQKTLLYVGTRPLSLEREAEIFAARNSGCQLLIADSSADAYRSFEIEHLVETPLAHPDRAVEDILSYIRQHSLQISGVTGWTDGAVGLVACLSDVLGLPGTSPQAVHHVRNKAQTREILAAGLPEANPRFAFIRTESEFLAALDDVGTPCLLKPPGSSGGRGIVKIADEKEALAKFRYFTELVRPEKDATYGLYDGVFLLEQQVIGTEHSVAGMVAGSVPYILAIIDKENDFSIPLQYQNTTPSLLPDSVQAQMVEMARAAVALVGIDWCGFHVDMMVEDGTPKILEIGGRLGGECINSHLLPLSLGEIRPYDRLLQVIQGYNPFLPQDAMRTPLSRAGGRALLPKNPGRIIALRGLEQVREHPALRGFSQIKTEGDVVRLPEDRPFDYTIAHIVAQCGLDRSIHQTLDELAALFSAEVQATLH